MLNLKIYNMSYTSPKYTHVSRQPAISKFQDEMASIFKDKRAAKELEMKENERKNQQILEFGRAENMAFNKRWWEKNQYDNPNAESLAKKFFANSGKEYADLAMKIKAGNCEDSSCSNEISLLNTLDQKPKVFSTFIGDVDTELSKTAGNNYDKNQDSDYALAYKVFKGEPGFTVKDGYKLDMVQNSDGTMEMVFSGKKFKDGKFQLNNNTLGQTLNAGGVLVNETPKLSFYQNEVLQDAGIFAADDFDEKGELKPGVVLEAEDWQVKGIDGNPVYETVVSADGMYQQNAIKWDEDKLNNKIKPYVDTQLELFNKNPKDMIGLWNLRLGKGAKSYDEDLARAALGMPDAEADVVKKAWKDQGYDAIVKGAWSYDDVPLSDKKKKLFAAHYTNKTKQDLKKRFFPPTPAPGINGQMTYTDAGFKRINAIRSNNSTQNWNVNP